MKVSLNSDSQKKRILSVEDDADSCELLEFVLSDYDIVFASNMRDALHLFESHDFHLCLFDNWLIDGTGTELCTKIRTLNKTVPIIFASGIGSKSDIKKALEAGAQAYIVKPYFPEELQKVVKEHIEKND